MKEYFGPPVFLDWFSRHFAELSALEDAKEGNPKALADLVLEGKPLQTDAARRWVRAKILNLPTETSRRKTAQDGMYLDYFHRVRKLTEQLNISKYKARLMILNQEPGLKEETLRTYVRKGELVDAEIRDHIKKRRRPIG